MRRTLFLLFAVSGACWPQTGATYDAASHRDIIYKPALPAIQGANTWIADPTFGTRILRVTDQNTIAGFPNVSYYTAAGAFVNTWAADSSAFFIRSDKGYQLFSFNPQSLVATRLGSLALDGVAFSYRNPKLIFGIAGRSIKQYDYSTGTYTTILDLNTVVPNFPEYVGAVAADDSDTIFVVPFGGHQDTHPYMVVYNRSNGSKSLLNLINSTIDGQPTNIALAGNGIHSVMLDRTGRYASTFLHGPGDGGYVWDVQTRQLTKYTVATSGHDVLGFGTRINQSGIKPDPNLGATDSMGFSLRSMADPNNNLRQLIDPPPAPPYQWGAGGHWSWANLKADAPNPIVGSFYRELWAIDKPWKTWDDEIVAVRTDGVESRVWRLAHHRSTMTNNFWDSPRGNVSQDGRYFIFTSNWEKTLGTNAGGGPREDVFLLELPLAGAATAAPPVIASLSPGSTAAGGPTFTLTVNGANFKPEARVRWNGEDLESYCVTASQMAASINYTRIASQGTAMITVVDGTGASNEAAFTITAPATAPAPIIGSLSPASATAGGSAFTLTVNGSNFTAAAAVLWNGARLATSFVSASQLTALVGATQIAVAGNAAVTVADGTGVSNEASFAINAPPPPAIASISPSSATAGGAAFTLAVTGSNFTAAATVRWNGASLTTTYVSATQLKAAVGSAQIGSQGTAKITVAAGTAVSNEVVFTINAPPSFAIGSLSPASATAGDPPFTLTVNGAGFVSGAAVRWNTTTLTTTFVSASQLKASVPQSLTMWAGTASITVRNPNGAISNAVAFTVRARPAGAPTLTSMSPSATTAGRGTFWLTIKGTGFVQGAVVKWNGAAVETRWSSSTQIVGIVPGTKIASPGTAYVTVMNPNGAASNALPFKIYP